MNLVVGLISFALLLTISIAVYGKRQAQRLAFIEAYRFPSGIQKKLLGAYPHLSEADCALVDKALREYFAMCFLAGQRVVAMPSQVVDVAWHEFILYTKNYAAFCQRGYGRFIHHTPAEAMEKPTQAQVGIRRAWRLACYREGINGKTPTQLPLLFAIDKQLKIESGFHYDLHCRGRGQGGYCASHIGCSSGCSSGCVSDSSSSSCSSGSSCSSCGGGD